MNKGRSRPRRGPSRESLRDIPEVVSDGAKVRRNPYARKVAVSGLTVHPTPGRPRKGTETGPTIPRSIRFPAEVWKRLEDRARAEGLPLHRALRAAVLAWADDLEHRSAR